MMAPSRCSRACPRGFRRGRTCCSRRLRPGALPAPRPRPRLAADVTQGSTCTASTAAPATAPTAPASTTPRQIGAGGAARADGQQRAIGPSLRGVGALAADFYLRTGLHAARRASDAQPRRAARAASRSSRSGADRVHRVARRRAGDPGAAALAGQPLAGAAPLHRPLRRLPPDRGGGRLRDGRGAAAARGATSRRRSPRRCASARTSCRASRRRRSATASSTRSSRTSQYTKDPDDPGGWAIGHIGPVPEGLVTWFIARRGARRRLHRDRKEAQGVIARLKDLLAGVVLLLLRRRGRRRGRRRARAHRPGRHARARAGSSP